MAFVRPGAKKASPMSRARRVAAFDSMQHMEEKSMKLSKVYNVLQRIRQFLRTSKEDLVREMSLMNRIAPEIPRWLDLSEEEQLEVYTGIKALERHAPTVRDEIVNDDASRTVSQEAKSPGKPTNASAFQSRLEPFVSPKRSKLNPQCIFTPYSTHTLPPNEYTVQESQWQKFDHLTRDLLRANGMSYIVTQEILESPTKQFNMIWHKWLNEGSRPSQRSQYRRLYVKDQDDSWLTHHEMMDKLSRGEVINILQRSIGNPESFSRTYHTQSSHSSRSQTPVPSPPILPSDTTTPVAMSSAVDDGEEDA